MLGRSGARSFPGRELGGKEGGCGEAAARRAVRFCSKNLMTMMRASRASSTSLNQVVKRPSCGCRSLCVRAQSRAKSELCDALTSDREVLSRYGRYAHIG